MFEAFRDRRKRRAIEKRFEPYFKQFREEGDEHRYERALSESQRAFEDLHGEIQQRETSRLLSEAEQYDVELPPADAWVESVAGLILGTGGRATLRKRIDEEKTRRREVKAWWWKTILAPALTFLIGAIGALTGLVAVWKKH